MSSVFPNLAELPDPPAATLRRASTVGEPTGHNRLVHGENLAALGALAAQEPGSVQCVYIDPPYNRGTDHSHYADARSRSEWLGFMAERLVLLRRLLRREGSLFVQLDDNQIDYLKVLLDDLFGADAFVGRITVQARAPSAFSTVNRGVFKASEYILWYARDRAHFVDHPVRVPRTPDPAYTKWIDNPDDPPTAWRTSTVRAAYTRASGVRAVRRADPAFQRFVVAHAGQVFRLAPISDTKAGAGTVAVKQQSRAAPGQVFVHDRGPDLSPVHVLNGQQICRYDRNVSIIDGVPTASRPLTNIWSDIAWEGIAREGGARFKQGKKPERLLRRVLQLSTRPGDRVLDAFGGSGTTAAVAHKMGRTWMLIEKGPQARTIALPRLQRVVDGDDPTGISASVGWSGGGGFSVWTVDRVSGLQQPSRTDEASGPGS